MAYKYLLVGVGWVVSKYIRTLELLQLPVDLTRRGILGNGDSLRAPDWQPDRPDAWLGY